MKISELKTFDPAEYLHDDDSRAAYLADALETDSPEFFADALAVVARSRGISDLARETGMTRPGIYKAISQEGNPSFQTMRRLLDALGLEFTVKTKAHA
jgi:probable addiction module antidote protein